MIFFTAFHAFDRHFFVEKSEKARKHKEISKTHLTKGGKGGKIVEPQSERGAGRTQKSELKFFQKNFEKGIDKRRRVWYNSQAVRKTGSDGH